MKDRATPPWSLKWQQQPEGQIWEKNFLVCALLTWRCAFVSWSRSGLLHENKILLKVFCVSHSFPQLALPHFKHENLSHLKWEVYQTVPLKIHRGGFLWCQWKITGDISFPFNWSDSIDQTQQLPVVVSVLADSHSPNLSYWASVIKWCCLGLVQGVLGRRVFLMCFKWSIKGTVVCLSTGCLRGSD